MKTKIVYALTSTEKDIYLEQTLVSLISLRKYNENAYVALMVDDQTDKTLVGFRSIILSYINEKIVVVTPQDYTQVQRSRFLKTTLRHNINGAFLFIDSDTLITSNLSDIDELLEKKVELAMVADYHTKLTDYTPFRILVENKLKKYGWNLGKNDLIYFNSGVMFVNDTAKTKDFFTSWNKHWISHISEGLHFDQPALAKTNQDFNLIITELDGSWNCQLMLNGIRFLYRAKIIHYFSSLKNPMSSYYFANNEAFLEIKQKQTIPLNVMHHIDNPQEAFIGAIDIIGVNDCINFINTGMYYLYKKNYRYYRFIEYIAYNLYRKWPFKKKN